MGRVASILCLAVAALAACGGDDEERLTRDEFVEQANDICEKGNGEIEDEAEQRFGDLEENPPADEAEEFLDDVLIPNVEQQLDDLRELEPPENLEDDVEEVLDDADAALEEASELEGSEVFEEDPFE